MPTPTESVGEFETALATTAGAWPSMDVRVLAVRNGDAWHNLLTLVRLQDQAVRPPERMEFLSETPSLVAARVTMPIDALAGLIEGVRGGEREVAGIAIRYVSVTRGSKPAPYEYAYARSGTTLEEQVEPGAPLLGHQLVLSGDGTSQVIQNLPGGVERLDRELRASDAPWDGLDMLVRLAFGVSRRLDQYPARLNVYAPLLAQFRIDRLRLSRGSFEFALECRNPALRRFCSVGYVSTLQGTLGARGKTAPSRPGDWADAAEGSIWTGTQDVGLADAAVIFARVGPYIVDRATVVDERLRVQRILVSAYEAVDPELTRLGASLLAPERSGQVEFERAVARVLLYCGFAVDSFAGDKRSGDAVDVVAHAPTEKVLLAVECTTGPLQSRDGKLSRLVARVQAIASRLDGERGPGTETVVIPVVATSLAAASASDEAAAQADGIVVLTNQALSELLAIARSGAGVGAALRVLRGRAAGHIAGANHLIWHSG